MYQDDTTRSLTLRDVIRMSTRLGAQDRAALFARILSDHRGDRTDGLHQREIIGPTGREVRVRDHHGREQTMLMFGSNNYLGLATHPYVKQRVREALDEHGAGVGGPPLLNGYTRLHRELEERLAAFEGQETALLYGSGYAAGVGLMSALPSRRDLVLYDAHSHACFLDGLRLGGIPARQFPHNDIEALEAALQARTGTPKDVFVAVEGVYSMEGDVAPLDRIAPLCKRHGALLVLDDAHGTGVAGPGGRGSAAQFGVEREVDVVSGTFSKAFAVSGGFVACSRDLADYLRFFSRSYVFSASLPPPTVAAVLAGLDVLEQEPERHQALMQNAALLSRGLARLGFPPPSPRSAISALRVPLGMDIRAAAHAFHREGIFINHVEYPAVSTAEQRFRISLSADHTAEDIERLLASVESVWAECMPEPGGDGMAPPDEEPPAEAFRGGF